MKRIRQFASWWRIHKNEPVFGKLPYPAPKVPLSAHDELLRNVNNILERGEGSVIPRPLQRFIWNHRDEILPGVESGALMERWHFEAARTYLLEHPEVAE